MVSGVICCSSKNKPSYFAPAVIYFNDAQKYNIPIEEVKRSASKRGGTFEHQRKNPDDSAFADDPESSGVRKNAGR